MKMIFASLAVIACVAVTAIALPRAGTPAYQYGLMGNNWWAAQTHLSVRTK